MRPTYLLTTLAAAGLLLAGALAAAPERRWGFTAGAEGWNLPAGASVVPDPQDAANRAVEVVATQPHHTRLELKGSEAAPDFVASLRFRVLSWEGAPPAVYVYGRSGAHGFRGISISGGDARGLCYRGQGQQNPGLGRAALGTPMEEGGWIHVKLVCIGDRVFGKAWRSEATEPRWHIAGAAEGQAAGTFAVGVWTSPRTPSRARVLFDDLTFRPLAAAGMEALGIREAVRKRLDLARVPAAAGAFETDAHLGLVTETTVLAFDRKTGELAHLVHRPSGQDFVAAKEYRPLFGVTLSKPGTRQTLEVEAEDFRDVRASRTGEGALELRFAGHPTLPLTVRVSANAGADGLARLRIAVSNPGEWAVRAIAFPRFASPAALGNDVADDRLLFPFSHTDGAVLEAPGAFSQSKEAAYPGTAAVQFAAFYDGAAGLFAGTLDAEGHCKRLEVRTAEGRSVEIPFTHLLPEVVGRDAAPPYDVALGTFTGDWMDAADLYKRWARQQPWCAKTLAQRGDIPKFWKEGAGIIISGIPNEKARPGEVQKRIDELPGLMAEYRRRTGFAHMVFVPYGWENRGTWAGIHYLPANPTDEAWRQANAALQAQGDRTAFLTSGFWWVTKRKASGNGPAFDDTAEFERRKEMVIHREDGNPWMVDAYEDPNGPAGWRGVSAALCHGSPEARETMRRTFLDVARLGTPLVSFDQEIGGGQLQPCYSATHGHPPGCGNWMWTGFRDLCREILEQGKPIQPELALFIENCGELTIPYMATYWSRQFGEVDHGAAGARGVALFSYLYHEYVTAIGAACVQGQGGRGTRPSAELRCRVLANNLTRGLIPGPFIQDVPLEPADEWHTLVSRAYFSYARPYARFPEYLLLGATRRPPEIACPDIEATYFRGGAGDERVETTVSLPAVTAGSFRAADGSVGTVVVNITAQPREATLALPAPAATAILHTAERKEERRWGALAQGQEIPISLDPFGVRVLVTR